MKSRKNKKTKNNIKQTGSTRALSGPARAFSFLFLIEHLRILLFINNNNIHTEEILYNDQVMDYELFVKTILNLSYHDLQKVCTMNKESRIICNDDLFWYTKITMDYGDVPQIAGKTWKEMYKFFVPIFRPNVYEYFTVPYGIEVLFKSKSEDKMIWAKVYEIREYNRIGVQYTGYKVKILGTELYEFITTNDVLNFEPPFGVAQPKWFEKYAASEES